MFKRSPIAELRVSRLELGPSCRTDPSLEHQQTVLVNIVFMAHSRWIPLESNPEVKLVMDWLLALYSRRITTAGI